MKTTVVLFSKIFKTEPFCGGSEDVSGTKPSGVAGVGEPPALLGPSGSSSQWDERLGPNTVGELLRQG